MKYLLPLLLLAACSNIFSAEKFNKRLALVQAQKYDDYSRWISIERELFETLLQTAEQDTTQDRRVLGEVKQKIVKGIISLRSDDVLLTQREFYAGILKYLPWDGNLLANRAVQILIDNNPRILNVSTQNFWHPNDVRLVPQS